MRPRRGRELPPGSHIRWRVRGVACACGAAHRSHKIEDPRHQPYAEACWYFTGSREQYRLAGRVRVVDKDSADEALLKVIPKPWNPWDPQALKLCAVAEG